MLLWWSGLSCVFKFGGCKFSPRTTRFFYDPNNSNWSWTVKWGWGDDSHDQCTGVPVFTHLHLIALIFQSYHAPGCLCTVPGRFWACRTVYRVLGTGVPGNCHSPLWTGEKGTFEIGSQVVCCEMSPPFLDDLLWLNWETCPARHFIPHSETDPKMGAQLIDSAFSRGASTWTHRFMTNIFTWAEMFDTI